MTNPAPRLRISSQAGSGSRPDDQGFKKTSGKRGPLTPRGPRLPIPCCEIRKVYDNSKGIAGLGLRENGSTFEPYCILTIVRTRRLISWSHALTFDTSFVGPKGRGLEGPKHTPCTNQRSFFRFCQLAAKSEAEVSRNRTPGLKTDQSDAWVRPRIDSFRKIDSVGKADAAGRAPTAPARAQECLEKRLMPMFGGVRQSAADMPIYAARRPGLQQPARQETTL